MTNDPEIDYGPLQKLIGRWQDNKVHPSPTVKRTQLITKH